MPNTPMAGGTTAPAITAEPLARDTQSQRFTGRNRGVTMISDDNFSPTQHTRLLNLALRLPR